ncbi:MAG: hypothetical protein AAGD14_09000 [Planctomycetota bacterium]
MWAAACLFLVAQAVDPIPIWIDDLAARDPARRDFAFRQLLHRGDRAAEALEARRFDHPEQRRLAQELLCLLRQPRWTVSATPFLHPQQRGLHVDVVVRNPRPRDVELAPFYVRAKRGIQLHPRWQFECTPKRAAGIRSTAPMLRPTRVPARSSVTIRLPVWVRGSHREIRFALRYLGDGYELKGQAVATSSRHALSQIGRHAASRNPQVREDVRTVIALRLRDKHYSMEFVQALRVVAASPYVDMRRGLAEALRDHGQRGRVELIDLLAKLGRDRNLSVTRAAYAGLATCLRPRQRHPAVHRLIARALARPQDRRAAFAHSLIASFGRRDRHVFLAHVLRGSRSPAVHREIASILRRDGVPVEPGPNGLVPASSIRQLSR